MKTLRNEQTKFNTVSSPIINEVGVSNRRTDIKTFDCWKCGTNHSYRQCPAYGKRCRKCNRYNHYEKNCKNRSINKQVAQIDINGQNDEDDGGVYFIGTLENNDESYSWFEYINKI